MTTKNQCQSLKLITELQLFTRKKSKTMKTIKRLFQEFYKELQKWGEASAYATQHRNGTNNNF